MNVETLKIKIYLQQRIYIYIEDAVVDKPALWCLNNEVTIKVWDKETDSGMYILAKYDYEKNKNGSWHLAIEELDYRGLPKWKILWYNEDTELTINIPESCNISYGIFDDYDSYFMDIYDYDERQKTLH